MRFSMMSVTKTFILLLFSIVIILSCSEESPFGSPAEPEYARADDGSSGTGDDSQITAGTMTAAEWNDLENWSQWDSVIANQNFASFPEYWGFYHNHRVSVQLVDNNNEPVIDTRVDLLRNNSTIWTARSDNFGKAELWVDLFQSSSNINWSDMQLSVGGGAVTAGAVVGYDDGINTVLMPTPTLPTERFEIVFVVDATGSMGDELEFLKVELLDVIDSVRSVNTGADLLTAAVFYRDEGDHYVTRESGFSADDDVTLDFIKAQVAGGGGDYPEAVHTALDRGINNLQWSTSAKTRLMFLLLDAPPHYETDIVDEIHTLIQSGAQKGIKIIPIVASGINKETEFLMRFIALSTNGTYVFITDDSGVGNDHLDPSVGEFQVELLNHLLVRLINKYMS